MSENEAVELIGQQVHMLIALQKEIARLHERLDKYEATISEFAGKYKPMLDMVGDPSSIMGMLG